MSYYHHFIIIILGPDFTYDQKHAIFGFLNLAYFNPPGYL
jgi:hypothetical protein